jgi:hypothetical protein
MTWQLVMAANLLASGAFGAIAYVILSGLVRGRQLRTNHLGAVTALIFVTVAVHHLLLGVQLLAPSVGIAKALGLALRHGWQWHNVVWDLLTAGIGIYYLFVRGSLAAPLRGAQMFEDHKIRERQALEINDNIVQGLTVAKYAMTIGADDHSKQAIDDTLVRARGIITDLLGEPGRAIELGPGDLRRVKPAVVLEKKEPPAA